ncbi:Fic family protein [Corynebacterium sp. USCH3]|uniref:Fic family protein n=1 Tax=Corynebacterium sp. USCH3 TaxID=3024840 RepID=UPI0030B71E6B
MTAHLTDDSLALADEATVAATRFDATEASGILPFAPLLLRGESVASSRIEQLTSSSRKVMEAELLSTPSGNAGNAALIAAATAQMTEAISTQELPSLRSILTMHELLLGPSAPSIAGTYRDAPVWIGGSDNHPVDSQFVPPAPGRVPALMDDLVGFMSRRDVPALVLAAVSHAQFETIHPFVDGNGRTGRALMHRILRARGVSRNGTLPLAAGILEDPGAYFSALDAYRDGDINAIVQLISRSALRGAELGEWLGEELSSIRRSWDGSVRARKDAADWKILDILIRQPVVDAERISGELDISLVNSRRALDRLEEDGVLLSAQIAKRRRAWRSPEVLDLLDEFSERAGRRGTP